MQNDIFYDHQSLNPPLLYFRLVRALSGEGFVSTTRTEKGVECSLGRLAFNLFKPTNLPVRITSIINSIGPKPVTPGSGTLAGVSTNYDLTTRWEAVNDSGLRGRLVLNGFCEENPERSDRMNVVFVSGRLEPDEGQDIAQ